MITTRFLLLAGGVLFAMAFIFSCSSEDAKEGSIEYGGQKYKTVVINGQELMAENLNYDVPGSKCYGNNPANCAKYGRLYDWATAMALYPSCVSRSCIDQIDTSHHQGICPGGWHIPTNAEWDKLYRYIDSSIDTTKSPYDSHTAGRYLKAKEGWDHCGPSRSSSSFSSSSRSISSSSFSSSGSSSSGSSSSSFGRSSSSRFSSSSGSDKVYQCDDTLGFAGLPGGYSNSGGFYEAGEVGFWWSASEEDASAAYMRYIYNRFDNASWGHGIKNYLYSVRCFKDT
ncbi:MAG: hypothetical protein FWF67_03285 [Fibromonadales bacterium]|nr:hypothetical protein [Fibromonadales bacterium]